MENCEEFAALLDAYVDGELSPQDARLVREHLLSCSRCRAYVQAALSIRSALPSPEEVQVPDGFAEGVMSAVRATHAAQKRRSRRKRYLVSMAACCAVILLAVSALPQLWQNALPAPVQTQDTAEASAGGESVPSVQSDADAGTQEDSETTAAPEERTVPAEDETESTADGSADTGVLPYTAPPAPAPAPASVGESSAEEEDSSAPKTAEIALDSQISPQTTTAGESEADADAWVDGSNVSFAFTVFLTPEEVGDALDGYTGKPYSSAASPEEGVLGTGYAMTADAARTLLLEILEVPLDPSLEQAEGDALGCIVVQDAAPPAD